jgi:hypothetical protein
MDRKEGEVQAAPETISAESKARFGKTLESVKAQLLEQIRLRTDSIERIPYIRPLIYVVIRKRNSLHAVRREMSFDEVRFKFDEIVYHLAERAEKIFRSGNLVLEAQIFPYEGLKNRLVEQVSLTGEPAETAPALADQMVKDTHEKIAERTPEAVRPAPPPSQRPRIKSSYSNPPSSRFPKPRMQVEPVGEPTEKPPVIEDFSELEKELEPGFLDKEIDYNLSDWNLPRLATPGKIRSVLKINKINSPRDLLQFLGSLNPTKVEWEIFVNRLNNGGIVNEVILGETSARQLLNWMRNHKLLPPLFRLGDI